MNLFLFFTLFPIKSRLTITKEVTKAWLRNATKLANSSLNVWVLCLFTTLKSTLLFPVLGFPYSQILNKFDCHTTTLTVWHTVSMEGRYSLHCVLCFWSFTTLRTEARALHALHHWPTSPTAHSEESVLGFSPPLLRAPVPSFALSCSTMLPLSSQWLLTWSTFWEINSVFVNIILLHFSLEPILRYHKTYLKSIK